MASQSARELDRHVPQATKTQNADVVALLGLLPLTDAKPALETLSRVLAQAPPALGDGFAYLLVALPGAPPLDGVRAGRRIRVFLSDRERFPTSIDGDAQWHRGEADLRLYATSAGGESPYLPEVYKGLYLE